MQRSPLLATIALIGLNWLGPGGMAAQVSPGDQLQVGPPPLRRADPPSATATPEALEQRGDELRAEKGYLDALDYYRAANAKQLNRAILFNKMGITELLLQRYRDAKKNFERAIKIDRQYADAHNNLGVVFYQQKNNGKAIREYEKAIDLRQDAASYFSNLGAAYFARKDFERAVLAYNSALQLDPDIFERTSRAGVSAQLSSPDDRAHYDYVLAKLYAKMGMPDRSLQYLRRAMEDGYKKLADVYKDAEFVELRKDPRFGELMASHPAVIPE